MDLLLTFPSSDLAKVEALVTVAVSDSRRSAQLDESDIKIHSRAILPLLVHVVTKHFNEPAERNSEEGGNECRI